MRAEHDEQVGADLLLVLLGDRLHGRRVFGVGRGLELRADSAMSRAFTTKSANCAAAVLVDERGRLVEAVPQIALGLRVTATLTR